MTRQNRTFGPNGSRFDPSGGRILTNHKFGMQESSYGSAAAAKAALEQAQKNDVNAVVGTRGAGGFLGKRWGIGRDGSLKSYIRTGRGSSGMSGWGTPFALPGYYLGDVEIAEQEQRPENPGPREFSASTWGQNIPVSIGNVRVATVVLEAAKIEPTIEGEYDYFVEYKVPIYEFGGTD
jgi:hypothetical protein